MTHLLQHCDISSGSAYRAEVCYTRDKSESVSYIPMFIFASYTFLRVVYLDCNVIVCPLLTSLCTTNYWVATSWYKSANAFKSQRHNANQCKQNILRIWWYYSRLERVQANRSNHSGAEPNNMICVGESKLWILSSTTSRTVCKIAGVDS